MTEIAYVDEDSQDLSQEELGQKILTLSQTDFVSKVGRHVCTCGGGMRMLKAELRRKKPHDYARLDMVCSSCEYVGRPLFQIDWVRPQGTQP